MIGYDSYAQYGQTAQQKALQNALAVKPGTAPGYQIGDDPYRAQVSNGAGGDFGMPPNPAPVQFRPQTPQYQPGPYGATVASNPSYGPPPGWTPPSPPSAPPPTSSSTSAQGGLGQAPSGWDQTKWADPNKHDPKYDIGRILAGAASGGKINAAGINSVLGQIQKLYPGTTFDGKDALNIPGVGNIDVIRGASAGNGTGDLQWLVPGGGSPQAAALSGALGGGNVLNSAAQGLYSSQASTSLLKQLMQQLGLNISGL